MSRKVMVSAKSWFKFSTLSEQTFSSNAIGNFAIFP
jgi:hypothetical protein